MAKRLFIGEEKESNTKSLSLYLAISSCLIGIDETIQTAIQWGKKPSKLEIIIIINQLYTDIVESM